MPSKLTCRIDVQELFLIWRSMTDAPRLVVASWEPRAAGGVLRYNGPDLAVAISRGFTGYPGLAGLGQTYRDEALTAFAARLPASGSSEYQTLLDIWRIDPAETDPFKVLAATGGRLPSDTFEFIPRIEPLAGTCFLTDIAGWQFFTTAEEMRAVRRGTELQLRPDPKNRFDPDAIVIRRQGRLIGYVKRVHNQSILAAMSQGRRVRASLSDVRRAALLPETFVLLAIQYS